MGGSLNITCTVDNASVMYDDVQFYRKNTLHSSFHQKYDLCSSSVDPVSKMQQLICGEGTSKNMSLTKVYVLYIQMATAKVGSDWHCQLKNDKTLSNTVTLVVIHGQSIFTLHNTYLYCIAASDKCLTYILILITYICILVTYILITHILILITFLFLLHTFLLHTFLFLLHSYSCYIHSYYTFLFLLHAFLFLHSYYTHPYYTHPYYIHSYYTHPYYIHSYYIHSYYILITYILILITYSLVLITFLLHTFLLHTFLFLLHTFLLNTFLFYFFHLQKSLFSE